MTYAEAHICPVPLCNAIRLPDGTVIGSCHAAGLAIGKPPEGARQVIEINGDRCFKGLDKLQQTVYLAERLTPVIIPPESTS